jgi:hypothetical protein
MTRTFFNWSDSALRKLKFEYGDLPMNVTFRPIDQGFALPKFFRESKFKAKYSQTLELLDRELRHLDAKGIVIELALDAYWLRNDGLPRSGARPTHPGVRLTFNSSGKQLSFPCATFGHWEDNLRAIALSLESLRAVDRYGVTQGSEQYTGFASIAAPSANSGSDEAFLRAFLCAASESGLRPEQVADWKVLYRAALIASHPDKPLGNHDTHIQVKEAGRVLGLAS